MRDFRVNPRRGRSRAGALLVLAAACSLVPGVATLNAQDVGVETGAVREVVAAVPRNFPPLVYVDENGRPVGFAVDMLNEIARRAGLQVKYLVENDWRGAARALADGRAQLVPGVGRTAAREKTMAFTRPFHTMPVSLFVRRSTNDIDGILDLAEHRVAVVRGNIGAAVLRPYRSISAVTYTSFEDALIALLAGHVDALAYPEPAVLQTARNIGVADRIKVVGPPLAEIKRSFAVRRDDAALLQRLDAALVAFLGTPEAMELFRKWHQPDPPFFSRKEVWWILSGVLLLSLIGLAAWRFASVVRLNRELVAAAAARKQAETERRISDERLNIAFETGSVGMTVTGADGTLQRVNEAFCKFLGYSEAELLGRPVFEFVHPDDLAKMNERRRRLLSGEEDRLQTERRYIRKDGGVVWGFSGVSAARRADGMIAYLVGNVQDITERKLAEAGRRDSEARVRGIMENIADSVVTIGSDGVIETVNPAVTRMFGYEAEELIGKPVNMLMPEPFATEHDRYLGAYLETGKGKILGIGPREVPGLRKDGSQFPMSLSVSEMRIGETRIFIGALRDITDQKRAEAELLRKTEFLDLVRTTAVAANEASNIEEAISVCLTNVCTTLGWPVGHAYVPARDGEPRMLPTTIWHIDDPERFAFYRKVTEETVFAEGDGLPGRIMKSSKPDWVTDYKRRQNSPRLAAANAVGLKSAFGVPVLAGSEVIAVLEFFSQEVTSRDEAVLEVMVQVGTQLGRVAERARAAEALRADEERLRQIIDLVPHRIFIKDRNGIYLLANKAVAEAHGVTTDELVGKANRDLHPEDSQPEKYLLDDLEVINTGRPKLVPEEIFFDRQGNRQVLRTIKVPYTVTETGERAVLGVSVDITEQKTAEEHLRHAQKMEAVGQLTGGLAHDFNNLLTIVLGNLQLLMRRLDDDELKEMVEAAERAGRRGAELTQRLLAFGRRQSLEPKIVDLNRLVVGMSDLLRRTLGETVEIETVTADDISQTLVDPAQVENAILNLAINARDAMPQGGTLTIRTGARKISQRDAVGGDDVTPGDYVMLAISDTGTGMPHDVAARAFDPFFTTKEVGRGSGLGLSMIYGFCQQSGGFATIDSEPGEGTTVSLFLPATDATEISETKTSADALDETGFETVLVVEDDPGVRMFATTVLSNLNYNVLEAQDGRSALETLESNGKIDVLFTDIVLPGGVDGRDVADQARTWQPDINVVFTSGFAVDDQDRENSRIEELTMLRKPYTGAELVAKIRTVIENLDRGSE